MGYFSNGTDGDMYEEEYCQQCVHDLDGDCPVMWLHKAYQDNRRFDKLLNDLIPLSKGGGYNEQCKMYHEATQEERTERARLEKEAALLEAWNRGGPIVIVPTGPYAGKIKRG